MRVTTSDSPRRERALKKGALRKGEGKRRKKKKKKKKRKNCTVYNLSILGRSRRRPALILRKQRIRRRYLFLRWTGVRLTFDYTVASTAYIHFVSLSASFDTLCNCFACSVRLLSFTFFSFSFFSTPPPLFPFCSPSS